MKTPYKVLVAEDEPKIRRRLISLIPWEELGMELAAQAEDGEEMLEIAMEIRPDIVIADIRMPFKTGLEAAEELKMAIPQCIVIIVTGHDEFDYARQALRLHVFDYLLKPIIRDSLQSVLLKAIEHLNQERLRSLHIDLSNRQLSKNKCYLRETFLNEWMQGRVTGKELENQLQFLQIDIAYPAGLLIVNIFDKLHPEGRLKEWDKHLLLFAVKNVVGELLYECSPSYTWTNSYGHIAAIVRIPDWAIWTEISGKISLHIDRYLKQRAWTMTETVSDGGLEQIRCAYETLQQRAVAESQGTPIIQLAKQYIETYFWKEELSLLEVAEEIHISHAYLSRLFREEVGISFIDYVTQVRVGNAARLLHDPAVKVYEVAEKVGYSSQHYFSTAFKRAQGVSPSEYKKGGK